MPDQVDVLITRTRPSSTDRDPADPDPDDLELPGYARPDDAGADLRLTEDTVLRPGERKLVGTGVAIALPPGYVGLVHPRSGLAARHGLTVVNAPGTVDAGYRGEIKVCLLNTDRDATITLTRGDRIAQLVVQRVSRVNFVSVSQLPGSIRGSDGHGSTGGMPVGSTTSRPADAGPDPHQGAASTEQQEHSS
ncbi:dUTP diphosphatase [Microlunatus soli]